jgi:hypothetical protein
MIVQTCITRGECFLIKENLPNWAKYADGFVFYVHGSEDDDTVEYLESVKEKYNILSILKDETGDDFEKKVVYETVHRQRMYDEAIKYSKKIIVMDTDEYLDGSMTKEELEKMLDDNPDTIFNLQWVQYTSKNKVRVDGPWRNNFKVRMGSYTKREDLGNALRHSGHIPPAPITLNVDPAKLFIAHLQWIDKRWVGVKQYFWKVTDYIRQSLHGEEIYPASAYDVSVANFNWQYDDAPLPLKVSEDVFDKEDITKNYKLQFIKKYIQKHNIPNLGDWGMGIHDWATDTKRSNDLSICIVTFKERYEDIKRLISQIRNDKDSAGVDILLAVNGNNEELMGESYRKDMLKLCEDTPQCYPVICPEFKSLPKLWNTLAIFSRTEYNFYLCDDVEYSGDSIINQVKDYIKKSKEGFFTINSGFSHFVLSKSCLHELKYFDERLIAYGEEDGDIIHQFIKIYNKNMTNLTIDGLFNKALYTQEFNAKKVEVHIDNKPKFNREFFYLKYKDDPNGIRGMNPTPVSVVKGMELEQQYPYEPFVKKNKHNIKKFEKILL